MSFSKEEAILDNRLRVVEVFIAAPIDADTLDGLDSLQFLRSDTADTAAGIITFSANPVIFPGDGSGTGGGTWRTDR